MSMRAEQDRHSSRAGCVVALADHWRDEAFVFQGRQRALGRDVGYAVLLAQRLATRQSLIGRGAVSGRG